MLERIRYTLGKLTRASGYGVGGWAAIESTGLGQVIQDGYVSLVSVLNLSDDWQRIIKAVAAIALIAFTSAWSVNHDRNLRS